MRRQQSGVRFALGTLRAPILFIFLLAPAVRAEDEVNLTQEVILRCIYDVGEFGEQAVHACMRADLAAAEALKKYPAEAQAIVDRCREAIGTRGYGMVQVCVERDIAATAALRRYSAQHSGAIQVCEHKVGKHSPAEVQACVDAAIAQQGTDQQ